MPLSPTTNSVTKAQLLEKEAARIRNCKECRRGKIGKAVAGEGNANAEIIFIGEAPGREEAATGRPFVGRSGKFLTQLLTSIGIKRQEVFITSPVKYLPKKGTPTASEIAHGATHLLRQIKIINPKIIVILGQVAAKALLKNPIKISKDHGKIVKFNEKTYFLTFHPAAALRFPKIKNLMFADFKKLKRLITKFN